MAIHLTDQQHQALESQQGQPVEVVDPLTKRVYVLVPAETYERVRDVLERPASDTRPQTPMTAETLAKQSPTAVIPMRQRIQDLETPPEVAAEISRYCKKLGLSRRRSRESVAEEMKLQYYFGGQYVAYLRTDEGKIIVAAGSLDEAFDRQLDLLSPAERRQVVLYTPSPWQDQVSTILTPWAHED